MKIFSESIANETEKPKLLKIKSWMDLLPKTPQDATGEITDSPTKTEKIRDQLIPIYCTILGLVILGLVVYVIWKFWKQSRIRKLNKSTLIKTDFKEGHHLVRDLGSSKTAVPICGKIKSEHKKSKQNKIEQDLLNKSIFSLPEDHIEAIIFSISDESSGKGWTDLARNQGYTNEEVEAIQLYHHNKLECVRHFLTKWSQQSPENHLKAFIKALHDIHRPDTILLIKLHLKKICHSRRSSHRTESINNNNNSNNNNNNTSNSVNDETDARICHNQLYLLDTTSRT